MTTIELEKTFFFFLISRKDYYFGRGELDSKVEGVMVKGDKNTNFFHQVAKSNRKFNKNDDVTSNPVEVKDHIVHFFTWLVLRMKTGGQIWMFFLSILLVRRMQLGRS